MNATGHDSIADAFEARLRNDLDGIASSTPTRAPGRFDPELRSIKTSGGVPRRNTAYLLTAAAVGALAVTGAIALATRSTPEPSASTPTASNTLPAATEQVDPCDDNGCSNFDPLPVAPGATDYYVGPSDLGEPDVVTEFFDELTRCTELSADSTTCAKIEGIAGVSLVAYLADGDVTATSDPENGFHSIEDATVRVGTTFADIAPTEYAEIWGPTPGNGPQEATTVRGHEAVRYLNESSPGLVWTERPGVLVWVVVPSDREDELAEIAENVRRVDGPTTIPYRVMIPELSTEWDVWDNNGEGLIAARSQGVECVGLDYVDTCGTDIVDRTIIRARIEGSVWVAGSTPTDVVTVRVDVGGNDTVDIDTMPFADSPSRFFSSMLDPDLGPIVDVTWLTADGEIAASMPNPDTVLPDASPETVDGTTAPTCTIPGTCGTYQVLDDDSPAVIAEKFCLTVDEFLQANGDGDYDSFGQVGSTVLIPTVDGRTTCPDVDASTGSGTWRTGSTTTVLPD